MSRTPRPQKGTFGIALLAGGLFVGAASLQEAHWWAFGIGFATILIHWALSRSDRDEEAADASYFLGFLLTLVLLAVGLWKLGVKAQPGSTTDVLPFLFDLSFGLGITVVGLGVRQIRALDTGGNGSTQEQDLAGKIEKLVVAQTDLASTVNLLSGKLNSTVLGESIEGANTALGNAQKAAADLGTKLVASASTMEKAIKKLEDAVTTATTNLETATGRADEEITRGFEALPSRIQAVLTTIEEQRKDVEAKLGKTVEAIEKSQQEVGVELHAHVLNWKQELETVRGHLVELHRGVHDEYGRGMTAVMQATKSFTELSQHVTEQMETLPDPSERLERLWTRIQRLDDLLSKNGRDAATHLGTLADKSTLASGAIVTLSDSAGRAADDIHQGGHAAGAALHTELKQIRGILDEFHRALEKGVRAVGAA